jgi:hypothetical protein
MKIEMGRDRPGSPLTAGVVATVREEETAVARIERVDWPGTERKRPN